MDKPKRFRKTAIAKALDNPDGKTNMRFILSRVIKQCGGYTRYVDLINEKDPETGKYTERANSLYVDAIDKLIKVEPKETIQDNQITVTFKGGMLLPRPKEELVGCVKQELELDDYKVSGAEEASDNIAEDMCIEQVR